MSTKFDADRPDRPAGTPATPPSSSFGEKRPNGSLAPLTASPTGAPSNPIAGTVGTAVGTSNAVESWSHFQRTGLLPATNGAGSPPDPQGLLRAFQRRWLTIMIFGVLCAGAAGAVLNHFIKGKYVAYAQLRVAGTQPKVVFNTADVPNTSDSNNYMKTQAALMKSRYVLNAALRQPKVADLMTVQSTTDPIGWLEDELKVEFADGAELLKLSLQGEVPEDLARLVNAIKDAYLSEIVNAEKTKRVKRLAELEKIYNNYEETLRSKRTTLKSLAKIAGANDSAVLTQKQQIMWSTLGDLKRQHNQVRYELLKLRARLRNPLDKPGGQTEQLDESTFNEIADNDQIIKDSMTRMTRLKNLIARHESILVDKNDDSLVRLRDQIKQCEEEIDARKAKLKPLLVDRAKSRAQKETAAFSAQVNEEMAQLTEQEKSLSAEVEQLATELEKVGTSSTELEMLRAEIKQVDLITAEVAQEMGRLRVELQATARVEPFQSADVPTRMDMKRKLLLVIGGPLAVFGLIAFAITWWEYRLRKIHTTDEVVSQIGTRVLGVLPRLPGKAKLFFDETEGTPSPRWACFLDTVDQVRTLLLREVAAGQPHLIMVGSAIGGEGKTTLAAYLARSLARSGRRTLLIDGDVRNPGVHTLFELPGQPGLSELLREEASVEAVLQPTGHRNLWVMPVGSWDPKLQLDMTQNQLENLFQVLKKDFEFILVDSAPLLQSRDAIVLAELADEILMTCMRGHSQSDKVNSAYQILGDLGLPILGAVVNGLEKDKYGNGFARPALPKPKTTRRAPAKVSA